MIVLADLGSGLKLRVGCLCVVVLDANARIVAGSLELLKVRVG